MTILSMSLLVIGAAQMMGVYACVCVYVCVHMSGTFFYIHTPRCRPLGPRESVLSIYTYSILFYIINREGRVGAQTRERKSLDTAERCTALE